VWGLYQTCFVLIIREIEEMDEIDLSQVRKGDGWLMSANRKEQK
jgi:hypothetical protein